MPEECLQADFVNLMSALSSRFHGTAYSPITGSDDADKSLIQIDFSHFGGLQSTFTNKEGVAVGNGIVSIISLKTCDEKTAPPATPPTVYDVQVAAGAINEHGGSFLGIEGSFVSTNIPYPANEPTSPYRTRVEGTWVVDAHCPNNIIFSFNEVISVVPDPTTDPNPKKGTVINVYTGVVSARSSHAACSPNVCSPPTAFTIPEEFTGINTVAISEETSDDCMITDKTTNPTYDLTDIKLSTFPSSATGCSVDLASFVAAGTCTSNIELSGGGPSVPPEPSRWTAQWRIDTWVLQVFTNSGSGFYVGQYTPESSYQPTIARINTPINPFKFVAGYEVFSNAIPSSKAPLPKDVKGYYSGTIVWDSPEDTKSDGTVIIASKYTTGAILQIKENTSQPSEQSGIYCGVLHVETNASKGRVVRCSSVNVDKEAYNDPIDVTVIISAAGEVNVATQEPSNSPSDFLISANVPKFPLAKGESLYLVATGTGLLGSKILSSITGTKTERKKATDPDSCKVSTGESCCPKDETTSEPYPNSCPCCFEYLPVQNNDVASGVKVFAISFSEVTQSDPRD
jgi:hypothetical protein